MSIKDFEQFEKIYFEGHGFNAKLYEQFYSNHDDDDDDEETYDERIEREKGEELERQLEEEKHKKYIEELRKNSPDPSEKWWERNKKSGF